MSLTCSTESYLRSIKNKHEDSEMFILGAIELSKIKKWVRFDTGTSRGWINVNCIHRVYYIYNKIF